MDVGNLISGSSGFPKSSLNVWKLTVHLLLKTGLENFENYLDSVCGSGVQLLLGWWMEACSFVGSLIIDESEIYKPEFKV